MECNGQDASNHGPTWGYAPFNHSMGCTQLAKGYEKAGSTEKQKKALLLGCWWDTSGKWNQLNSYGVCSYLADTLIGKGNTEAAKVILSNADGCHSKNRAGDTINACFADALQHSWLFRGDELRNLAIDAYRGETDVDAARYLSSIGINADVAAAEANRRQKNLNQSQSSKEADEDNDQAAAQRRQQADARQAAILGALQSIPDANPNSIQQVANQQEANMRAVGDANAAAQQQAVSARIAAQQAAAAQQLAAQQAAAAQQQAAQQQMSQQVAQPPAPAPAGTGCATVDNLVRATSNWRTGPGALDHEVVASLRITPSSR